MRSEIHSLSIFSLCFRREVDCLGHVAVESFAGEFFFEQSFYVWIFVKIFNLILSFSDEVRSFSRPARESKHTWRMKCEESDRLRARTEMLVEPHHWRHEET